MRSTTQAYQAKKTQSLSAWKWKHLSLILTCCIQVYGLAPFQDAQGQEKCSSLTSLTSQTTLIAGEDITTSAPHPPPRYSASNIHTLNYDYAKSIGKVPAVAKAKPSLERAIAGDSPWFDFARDQRFQIEHSPWDEASADQSWFSEVPSTKTAWELMNIYFIDKYNHDFKNKIFIEQILNDGTIFPTWKLLGVRAFNHLFSRLIFPALISEEYFPYDGDSEGNPIGDNRLVEITDHDLSHAIGVKAQFITWLPPDYDYEQTVQDFTEEQRVLYDTAFFLAFHEGMLFPESIEDGDGLFNDIRIYPDGLMSAFAVYRKYGESSDEILERLAEERGELWNAGLEADNIFWRTFISDDVHNDHCHFQFEFESPNSDRLFVSLHQIHADRHPMVSRFMDEHDLRTLLPPEVEQGIDEIENLQSVSDRDKFRFSSMLVEDFLNSAFTLFFQHHYYDLAKRHRDQSTINSTLKQ